MNFCQIDRRVETGKGRMYFYGRQVKETLMTATLRNGDVVSVITYTDNRCGLSRNNQPMHVFSWPTTQLDECVVTFLRLINTEGLLPTKSQQPQQPPQQPSPAPSAT